MKILWFSAAPWVATGYGTQTAIWCRRLRDAGHDVIIAPLAGKLGAATDFDGIPVLPAPFYVEAMPALLKAFIAQTRPDLTICLYDAWMMNPETFTDAKAAAIWFPSDTTHEPPAHPLFGIGAGDMRFLRESKVKPVAMSLDGQRRLQACGFDPPYVPHAIDTTVWRPLPDADRAAYRTELGIGPGTFAAGINASNLDPYRKSFAPQLLAFSRFHAKHPDSVLFLNTMTSQPNSLDLGQLMMACGLPASAVRVTNQVRMYSGGVTTEEMVYWYNALDVVMNASQGEGFGLAAIESQACGTPVILARNTTGPELAGPGWLVPTEPFFNATHVSWRGTPTVRGLLDALGKAHASVARGPVKRHASRVFAEQYDVERVWPLWEKTLPLLVQ